MDTQNQTRLERLVTEYRAVWSRELDSGEVVLIAPLLYHFAVYINPGEFGGYEDRYCIGDLQTAISAVTEYEATGRMRHWQKHHSKNISVTGRFAYGPGVPHTPEHALYEVDWEI